MNQSTLFSIQVAETVKPKRTTKTKKTPVVSDRLTDYIDISHKEKEPTEYDVTEDELNENRAAFLVKNEAAITEVSAAIGEYRILQDGRFYSEDTISFLLINPDCDEIYRSGSPWTILSWYKRNILGEKD